MQYDQPLEDALLRVSPIACAAADAFCESYPDGIPEHERNAFWAEIYRIEAITRPSALRKVKAPWACGIKAGEGSRR